MNPTYQSPDGRVTLYNADCLQVLPTLSGVDAVVTDPPYGLAYETGWLPETIAGDIYSRRGDGSIANDGDTALRDTVLSWALALRLPVAMFGSWKIKRPDNVRGLLIWDKGPASGMGDLSFPWKPSSEEIYIFGDGWAGRRDEGVLRFASVSRVSMGRMHPNDKPVSLLRHLMHKLPGAVTILDPFMGCGPGGVAALSENKKYIGIEIDPTYYTTAERRIRQAAQQKRMEI